MRFESIAVLLRRQSSRSIGVLTRVDTQRSGVNRCGTAAGSVLPQSASSFCMLKYAEAGFELETLLFEL
jgi:hypothetical protein